MRREILRHGNMSCSKNWGLTCVRNYSPSAKSIDVATFYFGRDMDELNPDSRASRVAVSYTHLTLPTIYSV